MRTVRQKGLRRSNKALSCAEGPHRGQLPEKMATSLGAPVSVQQQLRSGGVAAAAAHPVRVGQGRSSRLSVSAKLTPTGPTVAIVGITGAVGQEFLSVSSRSRLLPGPRQGGWTHRALASQVISQRNFPYKDLKFLASARCGALSLMPSRR